MTETERQEAVDERAAEAIRAREALTFIRDEARSVRRQLRKAKPTPRESMQAALIIIERVAATALGEDEGIRWPDA